MATIYLSLSSKVDATQKQEILIRFSHGRINQRAKTNIYIPADYTDENGKQKTIWDNEAQQIIIPNFRLANDEKKELKQYLTDQSEKLNLLTSNIQTLFNESDKNNIASDWLKDCIDKYYQHGKYTPQIDNIPKQLFFEIFDEFLKVKKFSDWRYKAFNVVIRALKRYEIYIQITKDKSFLLSLNTITPEILNDFDTFLRNEHTLPEQYPVLYEKIPESRIPQTRGQNTINEIFTKLRTFYIWAEKNEKTMNNPFRKFKIGECVYGTPFYITIDERNLLYNTDLSHRPALEKQRDIFVFQCVIGCRVGDLYKLTKKNIIDGEIQYIAGKTKDGKPRTVKVPMNKYARAIVEKYKDNPECDGDTLFPFISQQKYNYAIKGLFTAAGITRSVVTCDPLTRENVIRPINELASSHLARRCFVGNAYKVMKDQNLVAELSGHKQNSKAFARYREVDREMRNEVVSMIE